MSTLQNFGIPTGNIGGESQSRGGILMPKLKNRFRVNVTNFGIPAQVGFTQQVVTVARPTVNFNPVTIHSYNSIAYFAGKAEWGTVAVTVRDDVTNAVSRLIGAQLQKQMNFFEQTVPLTAGDYKFTMSIDTLDGAGSTSTGAAGVLETWTFEGCMLAEVNYQSFDYSSADAMTIELTIRADNVTSAQMPATMSVLLPTNMLT